MANYFLVCLKNKDPNKIFANAIREAEGGLGFNHVEILKVYDTGEAVSFGAVSPESRWCSLEDLEKTYEIMGKIPLKLAVPEYEADLILAELMGKPYSQLQIIIICAKLLLQKAITWLPYVKLNLSGLLICTELTGIFMARACEYEIDISIETLTIRETLEIARKALLTEGQAE